MKIRLYAAVNHYLFHHSDESIICIAAWYGGICAEGPNSYPISSYPLQLKEAVKGIKFKHLYSNGTLHPNTMFFI